MAFIVSSPVRAAITTITNAGSPSPIVLGQQAAMFGSLALPLANYPPSSAFPTGTVQFFEGATPVGPALTVNASAHLCSISPPCPDPVPVAVFSFNLSGLGVGNHTFTAVYSGDPLYAPSTSPPFTVVVNPVGARSTTITNAGSPSPIVLWQQAAMFGSLALPLANYPPSSAFPTGTVQFFEGATPIGPPLTVNASAHLCSISPPCPDPVPVAVFSFNLSGLGVGNHTFTAVYSGDPLYAPSTSPPFTVVVNPAPTFSGPTATSSGNATISLSGGGPLCGFTHAAFIPLAGGVGSPPAGSAPAGTLFPDGLIDFAASGCVPGSALTFTVVLPRPLPEGTHYWKYGPTPSMQTPHWYTVPANINGNTITFVIVDGGLGDDDLTANGTIVDQGGPGVWSAAVIPALNAWTLVLLALILGITGLAARRSRAPVQID